MPIALPLVALAPEALTIGAAGLTALGLWYGGKAVYNATHSSTPADQSQNAQQQAETKAQSGATSSNCNDCDEDDKKRKNDPIKNKEKLERQMKDRGWTDDQIEEAIKNGEQFPAKNFQTGGEATRYVHPETGRSVIIDNTTRGIIQVGGDGFKF